MFNDSDFAIIAHKASGSGELPGHSAELYVGELCNGERCNSELPDELLSELPGERYNDEPFANGRLPGTY